MQSTILFEQKSTYKPNYKIRIVKVKFEYVDNTIEYRLQVVKGESVIFEQMLNGRTYDISKAKQIDDDLVGCKDINILGSFDMNVLNSLHNR